MPAFAPLATVQTVMMMVGHRELLSFVGTNIDRESAAVTANSVNGGWGPVSGGHRVTQPLKSTEIAAHDRPRGVAFDRENPPC
jgi:hypothetical protein